MAPLDRHTLTTDPYKDAFWRTCNLTAYRGMYKAGLFLGLVGSEEGVCPDWNQPVGGIYHEALNLLQLEGGPSLFDKLLPAEHMIGRIYSKHWPTCSQEREKRGLPKTIERRPGVFGWASPCRAASCKDYVDEWSLSR